MREHGNLSPQAVSGETISSLLVALSAFSLCCAALGQDLRVSSTPALVLQAGDENYALAFSPDSKYLAAGGGGGFGPKSAIVFEMPGGSRVCELRGHANQIKDLVFTFDGKRIITGSNDRTIRVWDAHSGAQLGMMQDGQEVRAIGCSGGCKLIAAGGTGKVVTLWDAESFGMKGQLQQHADRIEGLDMSADGRFVASASHDSNVIIWDLERGGIAKTLPAGSDEVVAVAFSPDNSRMAAGGEDETVKQWTLPDFMGGSALAGHGNDVLSVAYSSDGRYLASGSRDGTVIVWDARSGQMLHQIRVGSDPWSVAFSPDGNFLAVGTGNKGVLVFKLEGVGSAIVIAKKPTGPDIPLPAPTGPDIQLTAPTSPDLQTSGPKLIVTGLVSDPEGITRVSVNGLDARLAEPSLEDVEKYGREHKVYRFVGEALLVVGENRIQIMAMDARGNVAEKRIIVNRMVGTVGPDGTQEITTTTTTAHTEPLGKRTKIAVLDIDAQGVKPEIALVLSETVRTELYNTGRFRVMNREDVDKVLKEKAFERATSLASNEKIAAMGTVLGVEKMVTGSVGRLGETYSVTLRMIDVNSHENERIATERHRGPEDGLFMTVEAVARKLSAGY